MKRNGNEIFTYLQCMESHSMPRCNGDFDGVRCTNAKAFHEFSARPWALLDYESRTCDYNYIVRIRIHFVGLLIRTETGNVEYAAPPKVNLNRM